MGEVAGTEKIEQSSTMEARGQRRAPSSGSEQEEWVARMDPLSLRDRTAVVTGVSRRNGIGFAIARRLVGMGADVLITHHRPHDLDQPWGGDDVGRVVEALRASLVREGQRVLDLGGDLSEKEAPRKVFALATHQFGHVDILVCNHARSGGDGALGELTAEMIDAHYAVNTRASLLLAQEFSIRHDGRRGGRIVFLTSGQHLGPLPGEICYGAANAALAGITLTIADQLADRGITVNTINPGPVDTGYADAEVKSMVATKFPMGRWGEPDDAARLIAWLVSDEGRWVTGQVINSEGGFARWR